MPDSAAFRQEGVRGEAEFYPDGWKDFIMMGILRSEKQQEINNAGDAEVDA